jgi:hypothetical protein
MTKETLLTYQGITLNKTQWADFLGLSYKSFNERVRKYYPDQPDKVFSETYLNPNDNMPNENILQARTRVKDSLQRQHKYCQLIKQRKFLKDAVASVDNQIKQSSFGV